MSKNAGIGHGTQFQRSDNGAVDGTFVKVGGVLNVTPPSLSRDVIDATDMDSEDRWREYIPGLRDAGEVTIEMEFDPDGADVAKWLADISSDVAGYYRIVFPDLTAWSFPAYATAYEPEDPNEEKMVASVTYKLTGKPDFIT